MDESDTLFKLSVFGQLVIYTGDEGLISPSAPGLADYLNTTYGATLPPPKWAFLLQAITDNIEDTEVLYVSPRLATWNEGYVEGRIY